VITKYFYFNGQRVAMDGEDGLQYLVGDHLGTTSLVLNANGTLHSEARHFPYGEERWPLESTFPTDYRFTGQRFHSYIKLYHMGARFYDPALGRWTSADTIVPDSSAPQSFNRYTWVLGNPLKFVDPTGHRETACDDSTQECLDDELYESYQWYCSENPNDPACQPGDPLEGSLWFLLYLSGAGVVEDLILLGGGLLGEGVATLIGWLGSQLCGDGDCTNEARSVWQQNVFRRGITIEDKAARSPFPSRNFPVIDRFENGVATSIKSIDLNAASYQNIDTLNRTVTKYIDAMATYQGQSPSWGGVRILPSQITATAVDLAIPATGASPAQLAALQKLQEYAQSVGVNLNIIPVQ
jgi:RHS repeat-associated protein